MAQRDYGYNQPLGVPGGIFDLSPKKILSRVTDEGVSAKPGMGLVRGVTPGETVKLPKTGAKAADFEGVFVHGSKQLEHSMSGTVATEGADTVGIMTAGRIWVLIASTATTDYGTGAALIISGDNAGKFTDASDAGETGKVALTGVIFIGIVDADNGIAVAEIKE